MKVLKNILIIILFIVIDIALWTIIGFVLLNYEDFYDESKGDYFSLESMSLIEKVAYFSYYLWIIINIALIIYILYRQIKKYIIKN